VEASVAGARGMASKKGTHGMIHLHSTMCSGEWKGNLPPSPSVDHDSWPASFTKGHASAVNRLHTRGHISP